ncbi:hypothetical protein EDB19DRAFT_1830880 [Suillus lakei]|nr:hypothetical protein EDB19DRAFT_1830880 [Suillus lakei]
MSEPGNGTTQMLSSDLSSGDQPESNLHPEFNQSCVNKCLQLVEDYKKGVIEKGDALLEIQTVLQTAIAESRSLSQLNFKPGFRHYLDLLDHISDDNEPTGRVQQDQHDEERDKESSEFELESVTKEKKLRTRLRRRELSEEAETDESGDEYNFVLRGKRRKLTSERLQYYPWLQPNSYCHISNCQAEQLTLECYEEWSEETKYYRGQVTGTPGCPGFPLSQWTLLLEG